MQKDEFAPLLSKLDLTFQNPKILQQAFYHRSYLNEVRLNIESNERLEFLGDSVLSLVISRYLYVSRREDSEGELTNLRAYIVRTKSLAKAAQKLELGKYLQLSKGEEMGGGRNNPQLLANTYEALLGAVFLDQGIDKAEQVISQTLMSLFEKEIKSGPPKDAKSNLQEIVQEKFKQSPKYKILETKGPDHAKQFIVAVLIQEKEYGRGVGNSKQVAEEEAASEALEKLSS
ncbi:ribonuclease III [Candidatus Daviesbacteria bacterium RIFCSPHIGHO2_02_FULL_39_12]|uniref:Ribonuclease 3 n=2 Tax=Candidatus Daviesiibacteriota TaxID=1752718 RepID=A0A1F5JA61_9BACT|nr:MAG: ribonuclease III [Candidatus Daviesbacteria bacterium RIFCSPHIGHO2_02_FULL_39_12]OGE71684.1 MAG: ribonuclease III [Candidatus Daviesbacteria bacterium RIFCSPLOWO2_02_FULL_38_15]